MTFKKNFVAVIKSKGSILREVDDTIFLPFGSEYAILLKNLESRKAVVSVDIDGLNALDDNSIIVEPNSTLELKGFMKGMSVTNKFKFIRKTQEISNYRGDRIDDGLVRIEFRFEKEIVTKIVDEYVSRRYEPLPLPRRPFYWVGDNTQNTVYDDSTAGNNNLVSFCCSNESSLNQSKIDSIEDGITVKGAKINQEFVYGDTEELDEQSSVIILKLRGTKLNRAKQRARKVKKAITVKTRIRCETCGRRSKASAKFCINCGAYLV